MKLAEDLRRSVLQAAIEGKLTVQRPEESAEELLTEIRREKEKFIAEGKFKQEKTMSKQKAEISHKFDIPNNWAWCHLGEITFNRDWERIPVSSTEREKRRKIYDYYGASGIIDKIDGYLFDEPLLLVGEDGANLLLRSSPIAFIATGKYWVNNHAHVLGVGKYVDMKYLCVCINAQSLAPYVTGTAQPKMNQENMNAIWIPLPPIDEQRRIVSRLDAILPLIAELEAAENELEILERRFPGEMRDSLLQAAIQGKLTGSNTDNWRWVLLKDVGITSTGTTPSTEHRHQQNTAINRTPPSTEHREYYNGDIPFIGSADLNFYGTMNYDTDKKLTHEGMQKSRCVNAGSVLQACIGTIGKVNVTEKLVCFNQQINAITPTQIDSYFLCYVLRSPYWQKQIQDNASQTTIPILNRRKWENLLIPLPPVKEQHKIVARLNEILPLCEALEKII